MRLLAETKLYHLKSRVAQLNDHFECDEIIKCILFKNQPRSNKSACKTRHAIHFICRNKHGKMQFIENKTHLFLLQINRKQMPIWISHEILSKQNGDQIHLHFVHCDTIACAPCVCVFFARCCIHCCFCYLICIGLFHNFSHLKLPGNTLRFHLS